MHAEPCAGESGSQPFGRLHGYPPAPTAVLAAGIAPACREASPAAVALRAHSRPQGREMGPPRSEWAVGDRPVAGGLLSAGWRRIAEPAHQGERRV